MSDLSKVKVNGTSYNLKDATGRANMTTLLGGHALSGLGAAAWQGVASAIDKDGLVSAAIAKAYVDAQVGTINKFDVVLASTLPTASADTMYKLYLTPKQGGAGTNAKEEWITIRNGAAGSYTYGWEKIGDTEVDLSNYVQKSTTIAGVDLQGSIAAGALADGLGLTAMAGTETASGKATPTGKVGEVDVTPAGNVTLNAFTQTSTAATLTKGDFTPAGSINVTPDAAGNILVGGSIDVTIKDAAAGTAVTDITYDSYTPAGTIAATATGSFTALKSATFAEDATNGVQISGTVSKPAITVTAGSEKSFVTGLKGGSAASFDTTKFHGGSAASLSAGFVTAGTDASLSAGAQASMTAQSKEKFVKKAYDFNYVAANEELDIAVVADTDTNFFAEAVIDRGTFTPNTLQTLTGGKATVIDTTKFNGGSAASIDAGIFTPNTLQDVNTDKVHDTPTAALAEAPAFTGAKYKVNVTADTALKEVAFTGTAADIKFKGAKYLKQEINTKTFTPSKANLAFAGTKAQNVLVTGVSYDKATANGATFAGTTKKVTPSLTLDEITVTVTADDVTPW